MLQVNTLISSTNFTQDHIFTLLDLRTREVEAFTEQINAVDNNIEFTKEDVKGDSLPLLDCAIPIEEEAVRLSSNTGAQAGGHGQRTRMVCKRSKRMYLCQTGTTVFEQRRWSKTLFITHLQ